MDMKKLGMLAVIFFLAYNVYALTTDFLTWQGNKQDSLGVLHHVMFYDNESDYVGLCYSRDNNANPALMILDAANNYKVLYDFEVGVNPMADDNHQQPYCNIDQTGHVHVMYGCHGSTCQYRRTSTPRQYFSKTDFIDLTNNVSLNRSTYPGIFILNDTHVGVIFRRSPDHNWSLKSSGDNGITWSTENIFYDQSAITSGATNFMYPVCRQLDWGDQLCPTYYLVPYTNLGFMHLDNTDWRKSDGTAYTLPITNTTLEMPVTLTSSLTGVCTLKRNSGAVLIPLEHADGTSVMINASGKWVMANVTDEPLARTGLTYANENNVFLFAEDDAAGQNQVQVWNSSANTNFEAWENRKNITLGDGERLRTINCMAGLGNTEPGVSVWSTWDGKIYLYDVSTDAIVQRTWAGMRVTGSGEWIKGVTIRGT